MKLPPEKLLYTIEEAAASLGIGTTKTRELINTDLRSVKIGRHRRIPISALKEYVVLLEMHQNSGIE